MQNIPKIIQKAAFSLFILINSGLYAQTDSAKVVPIKDGEFYGTTYFNGKVIPIIVIDGDTLPTMSAPDIQITRKRNFESRDERKRYNQWRKYAAKVYPLALEAVRLYRQIEKETEDMKKKKKKQYTSALEKDVKDKYLEEIKALTKSQGYILIKMIERELAKPFHKVISTVYGGGTSTKWDMVAFFWGYNLQKGYHPNDDEVLEMILSDLDLSYEYDMYNTDWKKDGEK